MKFDLSSKSWKTKTTGITLIGGAVLHLMFVGPLKAWFDAHGLSEEAIMLSLGAILTGVGFLLTRDNDKTSEQVGADAVSKVLNLQAKADKIVSSIPPNAAVPPPVTIPVPIPSTPPPPPPPPAV